MEKWVEKDNSLYKCFQFSDFVNAMAFITKVAIISEKMNHHPTWSNTYNKVEFWLSTHDMGGVVTELDRQLAIEIDKIYR